MKFLSRFQLFIGGIDLKAMQLSWQLDIITLITMMDTRGFLRFLRNTQLQWSLCVQDRILIFLVRKIMIQKGWLGRLFVDFFLIFIMMVIEWIFIDYDFLQVLNSAWEEGLCVAGENVFPCFDREVLMRLLETAKPSNDPDHHHFVFFNYKSPFPILPLFDTTLCFS